MVSFAWTSRSPQPPKPPITRTSRKTRATAKLRVRHTQAETTIYHGRRALKLTEEPAGSGQLLAILRSRSFHDGTIDVDVAGARAKTAAESDRGFIGITFRMQSDETHYECIYIRPTNGRAQDQLLSRDPLFIDKVRDIVGLYLNPPDRALVLCVDEKSQIHALDRTAPLLPMRPGQIERRSHDYKRHGTTSLFAAFDVASGHVLGHLHHRHRSREFRRFLDTIEGKRARRTRCAPHPGQLRYA